VDSNEEFWETFEEVPFKTPQLTVQKREGDGMLRRALENYPSMSAYVDSLQLKQLRNRREAAMLARVIDFSLGELGVSRTRKFSGTEVMIRRIVAISIGDHLNSWEAASQIEEGQRSLLTEKQQRKMLGAAKLQRALDSEVKGKDTPPTNKRSGGKE